MKLTTAKLKRLQQLLLSPDFSALVPPLVALPADDAIAMAAEWPDTAVDILRVAYAQRVARRTDWLDRVRTVCGPAPWIVRSAGLEDGESFVNAGGYASLICADEANFPTIVAGVTFSGFEPNAVAQQRLANPAYQPSPIACFVQPLINAGSTPIDPAVVPYLSARACADLRGIISNLHRHLGYEALDTEWALETDHGLVSVTGLTLTGQDGTRGQLAFGFGFASAQSPGQRENSVAYSWPSLSAPLWRGQRLLQVEVKKAWLVQARPAPGYTLERRVSRFTSRSRAGLAACLREVAVAPLSQASTPRHGVFLAAATLDDAWSRYLRLTPEARADLAAVFVESGAASEHAGIMFRQQKVPVFRTELARLPTAPGVVVDAVGEQVWFGALTSLPDLETEEAACIDLPADVQRVFDDEEPALAAPTVAHAAARLREAMSGLPQGVSARHVIECRSAWPADTWLQRGGKVRSPGLLGWLLDGSNTVEDALWQQWEGLFHATAYVRAMALCRNPGHELPSLCAERPELALEAETLVDLRLAMQLIQADTWSARLPQAGLGRLAYAALTSESARGLLECVLQTLDDTEALPIYEDADRLAIVQALSDAGSPSRGNVGIMSEDLRYAMRHGQLAPGALATLTRTPATFAAYLAFLAPLARFRAASAFAGAAEATALLDAAVELQQTLRDADLPALEGLCRIDLVDTYDQVLKAVLTDVVARRDELAHRRYLDLLANWIDFARVQSISETENAALASFSNWVIEAGRAPMPDNFLLELEEDAAERLGDQFLRWQSLMSIAGGVEADALPIRNGHQLHNLLHQWMLARFRAEADGELPRRLRELLTIADGFGDSRSCLLRLGRSVLEISLPMVVHKASFLFTEDELTVEFAELPDAPDDEIGRLLVFEALAHRIGEWHTAWHVSLNRVRSLGTWTLFLRVRRSDDDRLQMDDLRQMLIWFRVLFDAAYDFSYVSNEDVTHAYETFGQAPWPDLFHAYAAYREVIDFSEQRTTVYSLPFATSLAVLCQDEAVRERVVSAFQAGFEGAWQDFIATTDALDASEADMTTWSSRYSAAGQLGLLLAAVWPRQTLERIAQAPLSSIAGERIGASLLHRRDMASDLHRLIVPGAAPAGKALRELALHYAPSTVVKPDDASMIAREVVTAGRAFKRCKEYLLAHYADSLPESLCERLIAQLDLIPRGAKAQTEACLQRALARSASVHGRFDITAVDHIAIVRALDIESKA